MAARVRVVAELHGCSQYYQRNSESKNSNGGWYSRPDFVIDRNLAATMEEEAGRIFIKKLRAEFNDGRGGKLKLWLEDCHTAAKIEVPEERAPYTEDTRQPMLASLDEISWYIIRPANTPNGPKWFLQVQVPGLAAVQTIYADDELSVLQRADDMGWLHLVEKYSTAPPQQAPAAPPPGPRLRPGDIR